MNVIRASEIGEYLFCHRAWWLHVIQGHASANVREMAHGTVVHARHGRAVGLAAALRTAAVILLVVAVLLLIFGR